MKENTFGFVLWVRFLVGSTGWHGRPRGAQDHCRSGGTWPEARRSRETRKSGTTPMPGPVEDAGERKSAGGDQSQPEATASDTHGLARYQMNQFPPRGKCMCAGKAYGKEQGPGPPVLAAPPRPSG